MKIVVLGALSEIAEAACRHLATDGASLMLVGRSEEKLEAVAADLRTRGAAEVLTATADLAIADPDQSLHHYAEALGGLDAVVLAYGQLGDQAALAADPAATRALIDVNFGSAAGWCLCAAARFERMGAGTLVVIGSVAGDRGRQSNFIYGATKAGLAALVEGLAHRLAPGGARAVLIKPGLVATAMTAHMDRGGRLWCKPETVGRIVADAVRRPKATIVYAPGFWRPVMMIVRAIPSAVFHRTKL